MIFGDYRLVFYKSSGSGVSQCWECQATSDWLPRIHKRWLPYWVIEWTIVIDWAIIQWGQYQNKRINICFWATELDRGHPSSNVNPTQDLGNRAPTNQARIKSSSSLSSTYQESSLLWFETKTNTSSNLQTFNFSPGRGGNHTGCRIINGNK